MIYAAIAARQKATPAIYTLRDRGARAVTFPPRERKGASTKQQTPYAVPVPHTTYDGYK